MAITYRQPATVIVPAFMIELHTPPHHIGDDVDTLSSMETTFWVSIGLALLPTILQSVLFIEEISRFGVYRLDHALTLHG